MSSLNRLHSILHLREERYLPSAFDNSLSFLEKINKLIEYLNEVIENFNNVTDYVEENVEKQNAEILKLREEFEAIKDWIESDALTENVLIVLNQWYSEGKFQDLINEAIFSKYVDDELERFYIHPVKIGAVGDGITDDTQALQLAINFGMSNGVPVYLGNKKYKITASLVGGSNLHMTGNGAKILYSFIPKTYVNGVSVDENPALKISGGAGARTFLTVDAVSGTKSVTVGDVSNIKVGDYFQLGSEDYYPYSGIFTVPRGEIKKVRSITGNTVTFTTAIYEGYKVENSAFLRVLNWIENVDIQGIDFIGSNADQETTNNKEIGIDLYLVKDFNIEKNGFYGQDFVGIRPRSCILGNIIRNDITGTFRASSNTKGTVYYGIGVQNNCQWIYIGQNKGETLRRLGVVTSTQTDYGQPLFITFQGNQFRDSHFGSAGRVEGFEHHGFGRWITFDSNQVDSALGGIRFEGRDIICTNNLFTNIVGSGISFDSDAGIFENILVANNHITKAIEDGTSSTGFGIVIELVPADNRNRNIIIRDNLIHGFASATRSGIRVVKTEGAVPRNCKIIGNTVDSGRTGEPVEDGIGIWIEAKGFDIEDNKIYGYSRGIQMNAECDGNIVSGNTLKNSSAISGSVNGAISFFGSNLKSIRNIIQNASVGHRIISSAANSKLHDNVLIGVTTPTSNAGAGTVETSTQVL